MSWNEIGWIALFVLALPLLGWCLKALVAPLVRAMLDDGEKAKLVAEKRALLDTIEGLERERPRLQLSLNEARNEAQTYLAQRNAITQEYKDTCAKLREAQAMLSEKQVLLKQIERELRARRIGSPGSPISEGNDDILSMIRDKGTFERIRDASIESAYKSVCADNERLRAENKELKLQSASR